MIDCTPRAKAGCKECPRTNSIQPQTAVSPGSIRRIILRTAYRLTQWHCLRIFISLFGEIKKSTHARIHEHHRSAGGRNPSARCWPYDRELCVCQITELFGFAPSTVSKHLSLLFQAGLVESRKDGAGFITSCPAKALPWKCVRRWIGSRNHREQLAGPEDSKNSKDFEARPTALCKRNPKVKPTVLIPAPAISCRSHLAEGILRGGR